MKRILIIAHGHPQLSIGGGEIAAYRHCLALRRQGYEVLFIGWVREESGRAGTPFSVLPGHPQDILFHSNTFDYFLLSQRAKSLVHNGFRSLLDRFQPDLVHFHHYLHLGLELIREVRKYSATIPIALTLHEFIAICHHDGQMVKTNGAPCLRSSSLDCHHCFPSRSPQDFFLRELYVKSYFDLVDMFVAPSRFLMQRYIDWGIAPDRIAMIENGQPDEAAVAEPDGAVDAERLCRVFAFFGQISRLKGIFVLLDAAKALPRKLQRRIRIEINGSMQHQSDEFTARFRAAVDEAGDCVHFNGSYRSEEIPRLMRGVGWIMVPSVWWENSPLVIQEAFNCRRPVICSDIGGMAEKVRDGETGMHFRMGNAGDLAARIETAADPELWRELHGRIEPPPGLGETMQQHLALYRRIGASRARAAAARAAE